MDPGWKVVRGVVVGAALGAALCYVAMRLQQQQQQRSEADRSKDGQLSPLVPRVVTAPGHQAATAAACGLAGFEDDVILSEHLTRNVQFFGVPGQRRVCGSFVIVVGLGVSGPPGVGHGFVGGRAMGL